MVYKIVIIGDPHFKTSNIKDCDDFISKIVQTCKSENPNLIVILGDVLHEHERLHTIPLNKSYEFIRKMSEISTTYMLVGNHDLINNQQFLSTNHWMNALKDWPNIFIVDKPTTHSINQKLYLMFCPYVPNGRFIEALETSEHDWKSSLLIFAHQEFKGCKMGAIESIDGDTWSTEYPPIISGHIHSNQTLDTNVYYPGSAMQNAFGDPNNIIAVIDWNIDETDETNETEHDDSPVYNLREIDLGLRKKKLVYIDIENIDTYEIPDTQDDIKLTVNGTYDEFKIFRKGTKYQDIIKAGIRIVHKNKKVKITKDSNGTSSIDFEDNTEDSENIMFAENQGDFSNLVELLVNKENNSDVLSDFNYIFKNGEKDADFFVL